MTFKPVTYLVSFTAFVVIFMGLGGYVGYAKLADFFLAKSFQDALPVQAQIQAEPQGYGLRWEEQVALAQGLSARITAGGRSRPISIRYSDEPDPASRPAGGAGIPLAANERTEDLRIDRTGRYLYARVFATSNVQAQETTWIYKFDLQSRRVSRRAAVNPALLPVPFRP
jgi:hypothetical protein